MAANRDSHKRIPLAVIIMVLDWWLRCIIHGIIVVGMRLGVAGGSPLSTLDWSIDAKTSLCTSIVAFLLPTLWENATALWMRIAT